MYFLVFVCVFTQSHSSTLSVLVLSSQIWQEVSTNSFMRCCVLEKALLPFDCLNTSHGNPPQQKKEKKHKKHKTMWWNSISDVVALSWRDKQPKSLTDYPLTHHVMREWWQQDIQQPLRLPSAEDHYTLLNLPTLWEAFQFNLEELTGDISHVLGERQDTVNQMQTSTIPLVCN